MLFFVRVLLGAAESPSFPSAARTVRNVLSVRDRSAGLGLLFTGSSIGAMIAGPVSIWLKVHFGWRAAFGIAGALGTLWVPVFWLVTRDRSTRRAMEVRAEPGPSRDGWKLLLEPAVIRAVILVIGSAPAIMLVINWFPQMLQLTFHVLQDDQARYVWAPPAAFDAGAVGFGLLASRRDRASPVGIGEKRDLVALGAVLSATLALVARVSSPGWATVVLCVAMAGGGSLYTLLTAEMLARVDSRRTAMAGGITAAAQSVAHIVAAPLIGKSVDHWHSYSRALVFLGLWTLPLAAVWIAWPSVRREPASSS
jgi:ACS family hexuronate transporter-like MFS transporter